MFKNEGEAKASALVKMMAHTRRFTSGYLSHLQQPSGKLTSVLLSVMFDTRKPVKDVAPTALFHDETEAIGGLEEIQESYYVLVT